MIDVHCHVDQFKKPLEIAKRAEKNSIVTIAVTSLPDHFKLSYPHLMKFKKVRLALGFHPMLVGENRFEESLFKSMASKTSYIGEIGLDFSQVDKLKRQKQIGTLGSIFQIISDRPRFISLHSRKAEQVLFDLLDQYKISNAVFHWYSGPLTLIDKAIKAGHYFSVNPSMIKSKNGQKIIDRIPPDRILTETDGPYVKVKGRIAEPKDVKMILEFLKDIWRKTYQDTDKMIHQNFRKMISQMSINK